MEIPLTSLRGFYNLMGLFRTQTHIEILNDFNREKNFTRLLTIYEESKAHFKKYSGLDKFVDSSKRKKLPVPPPTISETNHVASILDKRGFNLVAKNPELGFEYIEREVSPLTTKGGVYYENGKSGKSSGSGGLDFIGWNIKNNLPVLGEIKVKDDENPFYAIIQLLTYLSELSTPNQIKRINYTDLFTGHKNIKGQFYLYILLSNYNINSYKRKILLKESKILANNLQKGIKEIKEIVFLKLDNPSADIEQIS